MPAPSVFIVEDEKITAEDISEIVTKLGYRVLGTARSGEKALEVLAKDRPDLVLMDIHLSGTIDGIETAGQIRTLYDIPVIFLTAHADDESLERAQVTEPYGYIIKPFDELELHSTIKMALYKRRMDDKAKENARTIRVLANAIPDAVMLLDNNQRIIALNDAMAYRLGASYASLAMTSPVAFDMAGAVSPLQSQIADVIRSGRPARFEETAGDEWFEVSVRLINTAPEAGPQIYVQYHNITDHKRVEDALKKDGISRLEQNMEQFQILNDQIRNPLQAIAGYVSLDGVKYRERILEQVGVIDTLVDRLDHGWLESEKVRRFLLRHYQGSSKSPAKSLPDRESSGGP